MVSYFLDSGHGVKYDNMGCQVSKQGIIFFKLFELPMYIFNNKQNDKIINFSERLARH